MAEILQELVNYAVAESAAVRGPVAVEKSDLKVQACEGCDGTGMVPTTQPLHRLDRDDRGEARDWHLAPVCYGVSACWECRGTGHRKIFA